jgi:hypothetical protein
MHERKNVSRMKANKLIFICSNTHNDATVIPGANTVYEIDRLVDSLMIQHHVIGKKDKRASRKGRQTRGSGFVRGNDVARGIAFSVVTLRSVAEPARDLSHSPPEQVK